MGFAALAALATVAALAFLAASIFPAQFIYIPDEPELLELATSLAAAHDRQGQASSSDLPPDLTFKFALANEYAVTTTHNRGINQRRGRYRTTSGLAMLASVFATLALVATIVVTYHPLSHGG